MLDIATTPHLRRFYWRWEKALQELLPGPGCTILSACSGGCDSIVLSWLLAESRNLGLCQLVLGHVNHQIRPESTAEEKFVTKIAAEWNLPLLIDKVDVPETAALHGQSLEQSARYLRLASLERMARANQCQFIALGHHQNDQAETVLLRLLRGAGPRGLGAMAPVAPLPKTGHDAAANPELTSSSPAGRPRLIRPLLSFSRDEIHAIASRGELEWIEDKSNENLDFLRNRIRHQLLPQLGRDYNPRIVESLSDLAHWQRQDDEPVSGMADEVYQTILQSRIVRQTDPESHQQYTPVILAVTPLINYPIAIITRVLWRAYQTISTTDTALSSNHMHALKSLVDCCRPQKTNSFGKDSSGASGREVHLPNRIRARLKNKTLIFEYHRPRPVITNEEPNGRENSSSIASDREERS